MQSKKIVRGHSWNSSIQIPVTGWCDNHFVYATIMWEIDPGDKTRCEFSFAFMLHIKETNHQYSHILDENRQENAKLLEKAFYNGRGAEPEVEVRRKQAAVVDQMNAMGFDPLQLAKVLSNPDMVKMLQMLAGNSAAT